MADIQAACRSCGTDTEQHRETRVIAGMRGDGPAGWFCGPECAHEKAKQHAKRRMCVSPNCSRHFEPSSGAGRPRKWCSESCRKSHYALLDRALKRLARGKIPRKTDEIRTAMYECDQLKLAWQNDKRNQMQYGIEGAPASAVPVEVDPNMWRALHTFRDKLQDALEARTRDERIERQERNENERLKRRAERGRKQHDTRNAWRKKVLGNLGGEIAADRVEREQENEPEPEQVNESGAVY